MKSFKVRRIKHKSVAVPQTQKVLADSNLNVEKAPVSFKGKVELIGLPEGIKYRPSMDIFDSSKVQAFMDCPRGFLFNYVFGWRKIDPNIHLEFGSSWHLAMEQLLNGGYGQESVAKAISKFQEHYSSKFPNDTEDHGVIAKSALTGLQAIVGYANRFGKVDKFDVIVTEVAGAVPISEERLFYVKNDGIIRDLRDNNGIWSIEHKTTGRNTAAWRDQWEIIIQTQAYAYALNCFFPGENVRGTLINGAVFHKDDHEFLRIPVRRTFDQLHGFLWELNHWIDQIMWNYEMLAKAKPEDKSLQAFPKNGQSCAKFGCKMGGLCHIWDNPLRKCGTMPAGYHLDDWDPRREDKAKNIISINGSEPKIVENKDV